MRNLFLKKKYLQRYLSKTLIDSQSINDDKVFSHRFGKKLPQLTSYFSWCITNGFREALPNSGFIQNVQPNLYTIVNIKPLGEHKFRQQQPKVVNNISKGNLKVSFVKTKLKKIWFKYICVEKQAYQELSKRDRQIKKLSNVYTFVVRHTLVPTKIPFFPYLLPSHHATNTKLLLKNINYLFTYPSKLNNVHVFTQETKVFKKAPLSGRSLRANFTFQKPQLVETLECKPFNKENYFRSIYFYVFNFSLMRPLFLITRLDTFYISEMLKLPIYPDRSNLDVRFLRNRLRKQILPAIRVLLNPQFDSVLSTFSELSSQNQI